MGDISEHFSRSEFRCHGYGHAGHVAHDLLIDPQLVPLLELLRATRRGPLRVVSGHRCWWWNARVPGSAKLSRHLRGEAVDVPYGLYRRDAARAVGFRGIGYRGSWATHVDVRPYSVEFPD